MIDGFLKSAATASGLDVLWLNFRPLASPYTAFIQFTWRDDFHGWAQRIHRLSVTNPRIAILSYSWGFGHGTLKLCRELGKLDMRVDTVLATDPVYHSWLAPHRGFMSLVMDDPKITVPWNVDRVMYFDQRMTRPYGHHLVKTPDSATVVEYLGQLNVPHANMDAHPKFFAKAQEVVKDFILRPQPAEAATDG